MAGLVGGASLLAVSAGSAAAGRNSLDRYVVSGTHRVVGATDLRLSLRAFVLLPAQWVDRKRSGATIRLRYDASSGCRYDVVVTNRAVRAPAGSAADHVRGALPSPIKVEDEGTRKKAAWLVVRPKGAGSFARVEGIRAIRTSYEATGEPVWHQLHATATRVTGDDCHFGHARTVADQIGDGFASVRTRADKR